jgi:hypothetical protein
MTNRWILLSQVNKKVGERMQAMGGGAGGATFQ